MDAPIKLIIHKSNLIFDSVTVTFSSVIRYEQKRKEKIVNLSKDLNSNSFHDNPQEGLIRLNKKGFNAYVVSAYIVLLIKSYIYRRDALKTLLHFLTCKVSNRINTEIIFIKLRTPRKQFLDYKWNDRITQIVLEHREVDHAMSWLSTLGGAFSALGEELQHCAEIAGKISIKQFELALRLGDPLLVARCKLYAALSLIQQGNLRTPKILVRNIYRFAIAQKDIRLQNMCQGIWAKLKYCYKIRREQIL